MRRTENLMLGVGVLLLAEAIIGVLTMGVTATLFLLAGTIVAINVLGFCVCIILIAANALRPAARSSLERGQASEAVLIFPLILGVIFVIIQAGIWAHARNIAVYSAREGATAAAAYQSDQSPEAATQAALDGNSDSVLRSYSVTSTGNDDSITVTVRGESLSLIPMVQLPAIEQSVTVPVETYVP
ncbi:TadE/TadG family type IV pilus assembly protein [Brachybacterium tyrofermentans]|uniref:TadE/TadG family type IV pilus assembly protein n=1 Tax=Brachybacterium tyrofermentans TaxID=47848 RepID=UPI003FD085B0